MEESSRDPTIDNPRSHLGGLKIFHVNTINRASPRVVEFLSNRQKYILEQSHSKNPIPRNVLQYFHFYITIYSRNKTCNKCSQL